MNDNCFHRGILFDALYHLGRDLFDPLHLGFTPVCSSTARENGYAPHYAIIGSQLFLTSVHINFWPEAALQVVVGKSPIVYGVPPSANEGYEYFFEGFQVSLAFTGALILGTEHIEDEHSERSWRPLWNYKQVREVLFEKGYVTDDFDRSVEIAELRQKLIDDKNDPPISGMKMLRKIERWTNKCFSQRYRMLVKFTAS